MEASFVRTISNTNVILHSGESYVQINGFLDISDVDEINRCFSICRCRLVSPNVSTYFLSKN